MMQAATGIDRKWSRCRGCSRRGLTYYRPQAAAGRRGGGTCRPRASTHRIAGKHREKTRGAGAGPGRAMAVAAVESGTVGISRRFGCVAA